ncbi:Acetylesterase [Paramyrothecium foliicola]|nr:Acetylesterase [Paramyrothecium foliicola]
MSLSRRFLSPALYLTACATVTFAQSTKYLMVFGDSYSTTSSFAGGATPSLANPIGNPQFPGQTTSGGLNWVGQAIAKLNSSVVLSHDFAVSGATIDTSIVQTWAGSGVDDQVDLFGQYIADAGTWNPQNTLTAVWVGINDVGHPYWDGIEAPICQAMQRYLQLLNILYGHGLRNFILFSVPPFDRAPAFLSEPVAKVDKLRANIVKYNNGVKNLLANFMDEHEDVEGQIFDTAPAFQKAYANPQAYGAPDATCVNGNGVSCLWYDNYHPGIAIQKLVAEDVVKQTRFF